MGGRPEETYEDAWCKVGGGEGQRTDMSKEEEERRNTAMQNNVSDVL